MIRPAATNFNAIYYDGLQPLRQPGSVELGTDGLALTIGDNPTVLWPYDQFTLAEDGSYGEPVRVESQSGQTLVVDSREFVEALSQFQGTPPPRLPLELRGVPLILLSCIAIGLVGAAYYFWGVRWASDLAARFLPHAIEERIGRSVVALLAPETVRCSSPPKIQALQPIVDRAAAATGSGNPFRVIYVDESVVNAFAAPGGYIVVYRGLLDAAATPEEFAGVLAHEMQHVILKHSTRAIAREFSGRAMLSLMAIDSGGTPTAVQAAGRLANLAYQRSDEEAADLAGAAALARAHIRADGLATFLQRLQGNAGAGAVPQYLSTHPALGERVAALDELTRRYSNTSVAPMPQETWDRDRAVCAGR